MTMLLRRGMTLFEVIIATAIFSGMLVMLMESMLNMRNLAATVDDMDILEEQATSAKRAISRDFSNSGWFYCKAGSNGKKFYPQIHLSQKETWQPEAITPSPTVVIPVYDSATKTMVDKTYPASVNQSRATLLGDAIIFTRIQPEGQRLTDRPAPLSAAIVDFKRQAPLPMSDYVHARPVQSLIINQKPDEDSGISSVLWETTPAEVAGGMDAAALFDDTRVRLFAYRVIPDPMTGRGRLIRFYSNPRTDRNLDDSWIEDEVIATDVVSMKIYSYEMSTWYALTAGERDFSKNAAAGLTNNQIRFVIQFARNMIQTDVQKAMDVNDRTTVANDEKTRGSTIKTLQFTIGLRSITNSIDQ
jgi:prepilin-type N-terminal cleavage/methylation domain-containing protein